MTIIADFVFITYVLFCGLILIIPQFFIVKALRDLLRQIRKIAALYPPFPVYQHDDEVLRADSGGVYVRPGWDDDADPTD